MQIVSPVDIEESVAQELAAAMPSGVSVTAYPPPDGMAPVSVAVQSLGSYEQSAVSDYFDIVAYVWASTYAQAYEAAFRVCGAIRALRFNASASGVEFSTSEANAPYEDPDPERQTLKRCTVRATVGVRGVGMTLQ